MNQQYLPRRFPSGRLPFRIILGATVVGIVLLLIFLAFGWAVTVDASGRTIQVEIENVSVSLRGVRITTGLVRIRVSDGAEQ